MADNTQLENLIAQATQAAEQLDSRIKSFLAWMTTIGLAATGFYLSFLFQMRGVAWIQESWSAKSALLVLVTSVVIGFLIRVLVESQQTAAGLLATYPVVEALNESELEKLTHELELMKTAGTGLTLGTHNVMLLRHIEDQLSEISATCDGVIEDVVFRKDMNFISSHFKAVRLTKYLMLQGATLIIGCAISIYVFWGAVFT